MNRCILCKNQENLDLIEAKELFIGTRQAFQYFSCPKCKSLSISKIPENIEDLYTKYPVFEFKSNSMGFWKQFLRRFVLLNQNFLARFFLNFLDSWEDLAFKALYGLNLDTSMKILDVGCGSGLLINMLRKFGFRDLTGIDPHLKQPVDQPGCKLLKKTINELDEQFDLVMCHHSFEHLEDMYSASRRLDALIKPGGWLVIRIPNIESYSFRKYKQFWHGIHAPFHFALPSSQGMQLLFKDTNLELHEKRQEQLVELFLYNIQNSLDIGLLEPLGILSFLGDGSLGHKIPPPFTRQDISYLKAKAKAVIKFNMADYVAYYYRKKC